MLNPKTNLRELCYLVVIDNIQPIQGSDNCEATIVGGWQIMVRKNEFKTGDIGVYFEIDSLLDSSNPVFAFMEKKHYKVKTQRYTFGGKGNFISQGMLMPISAFPGWGQSSDGAVIAFGKEHRVDDESRFLTADLGVTYNEPGDNARKAAADPNEKYKKMSQRHPELFRKKPIRWLMKREWGKKLLFVFFGKKKDKRGWPTWVVKTDEERVQNMPYILKDKAPWIATEKIDGTSTTFTIKRGKGFKKNEFLVCSRNVVFDKPDKKCFYETNVYTEMAEKYHMEEVLTDLLKKLPNTEWITIQGETYGAGIQKRDYGMKDHDFAAFNLITSSAGRYSTINMKTVLDGYGIPSVPIVDENFILPDTVEELLNYATGTSVIDGGMREGIVFRYKDGTKSFKAVSNEFLLKYHG